MASENFVDYVKICCRSGKGGAGSAHFRREKFVPRGGPDGGDGGRGGHIIIKGNAQLWTLLHLKYRKHVIAEPGQGGMGALKSGKEGEDIILEVPLGTIAKDAETGKFIVRLLRMAKSIFWFLEDAGDWETITLKLLPTKRLTMHNPENLARRNGKF